MVNQTLQTARVNHGKETQKAQARETRFRKRSTLLRSLSPSTGTSLLHALNQQVELAEEETAGSPDCDQMIFPPQTYSDRYSLALLDESLHNTLTAVVGMTMMQHDYRQREARAVFELLTQDRSSVKPDNKFYEKRAEIKEILKNRFLKTNRFKLTFSEKEIETVAISESEAEENYALLELCARLLGQPIFSAPFNPAQPIPALASNARNFDEENAVEHRRILAAISPRSFKNLIESLGYTKMKKKAKGPVLNTAVISGNGNNGNHGTPLIEESEADTTQDEINVIVDDFADSVQFRRRLKHPKLEVVVDGIAMSAPFAATSAAIRRFHLSGLARFVQVFATQNGRRDIVSCLSLPQTEISGGRTWHSELELEGKQVVRLTVEPAMDDSGKLASSSLLVGYQPKLTRFNKLATVLQDSLARGRELWPSWMTKPIFASIVCVLGLAPFSAIDMFSLSAFFILTLSLTAFLLVAGRISPTWRLVRPQQVAIDGFVALMLVAMLSLGILPLGRVPAPAIAANAPNSTAGTVSPAAWMVAAARPIAPELEVVTLDPAESRNSFWFSAHVNGSQGSGSQLSLSIPGTTYEPTQDYVLVRPTRSSTDSWQDRLHGTEQEASFLSAAFNLQPRSFSPIWQESVHNRRRPERKPIEAPNDGTAAMANKNELASFRAPGVKRAADRSVTLRDVFHVEVLVDTSEIITLIGNGSTVATELVTPVGSSQPGTVGTPVGTPGLPGNSAVADAVNQSASDIQPSTAEVTKTADAAASPIAVVTARTAAAWVVFESPTQLGSLNKGDVVKANFKPMLLSTTDPRGALLVCTATGVVQDKRTSGTDVEIRVGLKLTWVQNGNTVNGNLDLLLTDCAQDKENSHYGVLAAPQNQVAEVARIESRPRKP